MRRRDWLRTWALGAVLAATLAGGGAWAAGPRRAAPQDASGQGGDAVLQAAARRLLGADQGAYVLAEDGRVLVDQAGQLAVHPASLSKIPTTLALLARLGAAHRFTTTLRAGGPVRAGTLEGTLWVEAAGDPFLVDESALRMAAALRAQGIERVSGGLAASGTLYFDWRLDDAASRLHDALTGHAPLSAWQALQAGGRGDGDAGSADAPLPPLPRLAIEGPVAAADALPPGLPVLLVHRSPPLVTLAKALNDYSNNIFAPLATAVDGPGAVQSAARAALPAAWRDEVTLGDGAGMDPANRMSPRAVVALLRALQRQLAASGHSLTDILPVSGVDPGTLRARLDGPGEAGHVVGKTGTYGDYGASALAGALRTRQGTVYFALLNHGVPVPTARRRQDAFVRALLARLPTLPWDYAAPAHAPLAEAQVEAGTP